MWNKFHHLLQGRPTPNSNSDAGVARLGLERKDLACRRMHNPKKFLYQEAVTSSLTLL